MLKEIALSCALVVAAPLTAMAHGQLWYEKNAHVPQYKKIMIYPWGTTWSDEWLRSDDESNIRYQMNDYIDKKLGRRLKYKTISLGRTLKENKNIRTDEEKYNSLTDAAPSETARADRIRNIDPGVNGYLIPRIAENRDEPHLSPETTVTVPMHSYIQETGGPNGDRTYGESNWTERYTIPAREQNMHHMAINCAMYDDYGKTVMTFANEAHEYNNENYKKKEIHMYKHLVDEFYKDVKEMVQKPDEGAEKRIGAKIGFGNIELPSNVGSNSTLLRSVYFTTKSRAYRMEKARIIYNNDQGQPDYYVRGWISYYNLDRRWQPPYATTYDSLVSDDKSDWVDVYGNKHTMHTKKYKSEITGHYGEWIYTARVNGTFQLVDARNNRVVVEYSANEEDDKTGDALIHLIDAFYDRVEAAIY